MAMFINENEQIVEGGELIEGILYHETFPSSGVSGFYEVTETEQPTIDSTMIITGYRVDLIDEVYTQVWETREKTAEEYATELLASKQAKHLELEITYWDCVTQDIEYTTVNNSTKMYQANQSSIWNIKSMIATYPVETPESFYWVTSDDYRETPFLKEDLQNLASLIGNRGWGYFQHWQDKKVLVEESSTIEAVNAIVW